MDMKSHVICIKMGEYNVKKWICAICVLVMAFVMVSCGMDTAKEETKEKHKIGVLVYNIGDEEVQAFKGYLDNYIASCFPDVEFLYSDSVMTAEEGIDFINNAADNGAEGIMSFVSRDLEGEIQACENNKIFYMYASGLVPEDKFQAVENNPWFLGEVGPSEAEETAAGYNMAKHFIENNTGKNYFLLSGGASMGNAMHKARMTGILNAFEKECNVTFDQDVNSLIMTEEVVTLTAGDYSITICPGYLSREDYHDQAVDTYEKGQYDVALSVIPVIDLGQMMKGKTVLGAVDSYTDANQKLFNDGTMQYLVGKYSSMIGPSFAVMYNAVTGHADVMRADGKAFKVQQGFWISDSKEDFQKKYTLATSLEINAYNYEDLQKVCCEFNPDASLDDVRKLALEYTYEDVIQRRGLDKNTANQ